MGKSNRLVLVSVLVGAAVLVSGAVMAGNTYFTDVILSGTAASGTASGTLTTVRNSNDATQFILCQVTAGTNSSTVQCTAKDTAGTFRSCTSSAAPLVQAALGMTAYGHLLFNWNNGSCTQITVTNGSRFLP